MTTTSKPRSSIFLSIVIHSFCYARSTYVSIYVQPAPAVNALMVLLHLREVAVVGQTLIQTELCEDVHSRGVVSPLALAMPHSSRHTRSLPAFACCVRASRPWW